MQLAWDSKHHCVNHPKMDAIHKEFVELYNRVYDNGSDIKQTLIQLLEHTKLHFQVEEHDMELYSYPRMYEHKTEHQRLIWEIEHFLQVSSSKFGENIMKKFYHEQIPEWFTLHLSNLDSDLSSFLKTKQKGL
jgi:hemerythrin